MAQEDVFKKLVSHCKEYGFVFPSSDIYDGLGAVYDYGQMGVELKTLSALTLQSLCTLPSGRLPDMWMHLTIR